MKLRHVVFYLTVAVVFCAALLLRKPDPPPPEATLADGTRLRVVAVTCGTNHIVGPFLGRLTARLPKKAADFVRKLGGPRFDAIEFSTGTWEMRIWYSSSPPPGALSAPPQSYFATLADQNGAVSGEGTIFWGGNSLFSVGFKAIPRRSREIELRICTHAEGMNPPDTLASLRFQNPIYRAYSLWTPQPLPATNVVGDLEVVLKHFSTGHGIGTHTSFGADPANRSKRSVTITYPDRSARREARSAFVLRLRSLQKTNETWNIAKTRVSDPTGNSLPNTGMGSQSVGRHHVAADFTPSLWPDEAAWRLEIDLKRTAGFDDSELVTFKGVPLPDVGKTNFIVASAEANGVKVALERIVRRAPLEDFSTTRSDDASEFHLRYSPSAPGLHCDFLRVTTDAGVTTSNASSRSGDGTAGYMPYDLPLDARTVDIVVAVHRVRTASFLVKPEMKESFTVEYEEP